MQMLQCPLMGSRGQALEERDSPVRQYEAQNVGYAPGHIQSSNAGTQPTGLRMVQIRQTERDKAAEAWCSQKYVERKWQRQGQSKRKGKEKSKRRSKEKGKSKDKSKEGTSDTSNTKCSFCKGKDRPKSLTSPAESCASWPWSTAMRQFMCADSKNGQGDSFRKLSEARPLPGAEMQQRGVRQMSCDSEAGRVAAVCSVLDMRRSIWSLGSMMDSSCNVYFAKDRCWISKHNGKELDVILSGGVFFVAAKPSKLSSRKRSVLDLNSTSHVEVKRATSTSVQVGFGVPDPAARDTLDGDEPSVRIRILTGSVIPSAEEKPCATSGHAPHRRWCWWCAAARAADEPHLRKYQPGTDEVRILSMQPRIGRTGGTFSSIERKRTPATFTNTAGAHPCNLHEHNGAVSCDILVCTTPTGFLADSHWRAQDPSGSHSRG